MLHGTFDFVLFLMGAIQAAFEVRQLCVEWVAVVCCAVRSCNVRALLFAFTFLAHFIHLLRIYSHNHTYSMLLLLLNNVT